MPGPRLAPVAVPTCEVLALTAELASLGGGDVAVGRCWVGAVVPGGSAAVAGAAAAAALLDACCPDAGSLLGSLHQELWPWLRGGYNASVLLLGQGNIGTEGSAGSSSGHGDGAGSGDGCSSSSGRLASWEVLALVGGAALSEGGQLGISWQLLCEDGVRGPLSQKQQPPGAAASTRQGQVQRPSSRLGRAAAAEAGDAAGQCCTVQMATTSELAQVVAVLQSQLQAPADAAAGAGSVQPPALLVRLELLPGPGRQQGAVLQILQTAADGSSSSGNGGSSPSKGHRGSGAASQQNQQQQQQQQQQPQQGASAGSQWGALIRLIRELADLHQRRREGDHLLAAAKLSPLNQLAAPLLAGSARLFVAAALPSSSEPGSGEHGGSSGGTQERPLLQPLLPLLTSLQHVQAVCTKWAGVPAGSGEAGGLLLPCEQFLQQLQQQQAAERHRRAEAAALAAAEADRREKMRAVAKERREQQQQLGAVASSMPAAAQLAPQQQLPPEQQQKQQVQQEPAPAASYKPGAYGSPPKELQRQQQQRRQQQQQQLAAGHASAEATVQMPAPADQAGTCNAVHATQAHGDSILHASDDCSTGSGGSLHHLRQQFQSLYAAIATSPHRRHQSAGIAAGTTGRAAALPCRAQGSPGSSARGKVGGSSASPCLREQSAHQHQTIAAGVAAADDIATHVAALRMQAAAEARRALHAEQQLLGVSSAAREPGSPAAGAAGDAPDPDFTWSSCGCGSSDGSSGRPSSAGLGRQLERELQLLRQHAAAAAARPAGENTPAWARADASGADVASLADLEAEAPSLAAMYRAPVSRMAGREAAPLAAAVRSIDSQPPAQEEQQQEAQQRHLWSARAGSSAADGAAPWPTAGLSPGAGGTEVSDYFKSDRMPFSTHPGGGSTAAAGVGIAAPGRAAEAGQPTGGGASSDWWEAGPHSSGIHCPGEGRSLLPEQEHQAEAPGSASGGGSSYAASWQRRFGSSSLEAAADAAATAVGGQPGPRLERHVANAAACCDGSSGCSSGARQHRSSTAVALMPATSTTEEPCGEEEAGSAEVACLLEELHREQRVNAALLQQLHQVQQALEEALAAAAAAQQPLAAGVEDPADFNALLAALQRERQQHAALQGQLLLQQQQAEERELALEARLHTQHRQLLVAAARCRAWEQQSPMASLFQRYEEDLQRQLAASWRLEQENRQLAALLAEADLEQLAAASAQMADDPAAALCREHQRKLQQAQAQIRRLHEQQAALQKEVQAAQRRDRLAELFRWQAESGQRAAAETRQQLAARERQLEGQSLAAAEAGAEAARLRERLRQCELELGRALADRADLSDAVASLRQQVSLLRGQGSRDRILKSMQFAAPG